MSQLVRLEGKHTAQTAHCAMDRTPEPMVNTDGGPTRSAGEIENKTVSSHFLLTQKSQTLVL